MKFFQLIQRIFLDFLFPPCCANCKAEGEFLCESCVNDFKKRKISSWVQSPERREWQHLNGVIYGLDYAENPSIKAAIQQFKYKFTKELAEYFAELMIEKLGELSMVKIRTIVLIPIPLHKKRLNERGFNQSEVIAKVIQLKYPQVKVADLLVRTKYTTQQAKLKRIDRQKNLEEAFAFNVKSDHSFKSNNVYFLVDDVCTTGSTLENAAAILKEHGFKKIYGLTIARQFASRK